MATRQCEHPKRTRQELGQWGCSGQSFVYCVSPSMHWRRNYVSRLWMCTSARLCSKSPSIRLYREGRNRMPLAPTLSKCFTYVLYQHKTLSHFVDASNISAPTRLIDTYPRLGKVFRRHPQPAQLVRRRLSLPNLHHGDVPVF